MLTDSSPVPVREIECRVRGAVVNTLQLERLAMPRSSCTENTFYGAHFSSSSEIALASSKVYTPSPTLRSSSSISLVVPRIRLTTMGARSFSYAAPRLWNSLPLDIRNSNCLTDIGINIGGSGSHGRTANSWSHGGSGSSGGHGRTGSSGGHGRTGNSGSHGGSGSSGGHGRTGSSGNQWRNRELGEPWWIRELSRPQQNRELVEPWQIRELGEPWQIRELRRPWQNRKMDWELEPSLGWTWDQKPSLGLTWGQEPTPG
ncbi:Collagen alpha-5(VI) chain [Labeo rohita]|uniref:Collagen alpha-5(VI) chain n=1 Tax=Labeo rohita TaxID=84645 RepID=A0ABQ8MCC6_LABRO|nr:Collagen alpha-5(VI) chain [Labeo rohita]